MKKYMVIEVFRMGNPDAVYTRFQEKGRMLPSGLHYLDSWLDHTGSRCFQLMETSQPALFDQWVQDWEDLVEFDIIELGQKPN